MDEALRQHIRKQAWHNFAVNLVLNGLIAWMLLRGRPAFGAWGEHGYGPDMMATGFILAALVGVIVIKIHRAKRLKGEFENLPDAALGVLASVARRGDWGNALLFGLAGALLSAGFVGMLMLLPLPPFEPQTYAVVKGVWAGVLAALVVPPAIKLGLRTT